MRYSMAAATLLAIATTLPGSAWAQSQRAAAPQRANSPFYAPSASYYPSRTNPYAFPMLLPQQTAERPRPRIYVAPKKRHRKQVSSRNVREMAERRGFKRVSDLVHFPKFFPGLGIIYVKPDTLPLGPFLCFDRRNRLVATVYMVPIKDMDDHKSFEGTAPDFAGRVDHVSIYHNAGHPGVDTPHYHIVNWHVDRDGEKAVAH